MSEVRVLPTAESLRKRGNNFRAMLTDTRDLLAGLRYASPEDQLAANLQVEAINEVLTDDIKTA